MITKAQKKHIKSLKQKKYRKLHQEFVVEGNKSINDFIKNGYEPVFIFSAGEPGWKNGPEILPVTKKELNEISFLKHPKDSLAVFKMKKENPVSFDKPVIVLDGIQDPGNLGTIIRTADWFGIKDIVCSPDTVDCYSPKVVQASMGSLANINMHYKNLEDFFKTYSFPVFGTFMEGENALQIKYPSRFAMVIGNEGNGITKETMKYIDKKITIPKHPGASAESLNAAIANAIILSKVFS